MRLIGLDETGEHRGLGEQGHVVHRTRMYRTRSIYSDRIRDLVGVTLLDDLANLIPSFATDDVVAREAGLVARHGD